MALYRRWAELKTKLSKAAREKAGEKQWKELSNDVVKIKLQRTTWRSDIEKHKADRSILGFLANSASVKNSAFFAPAPFAFDLTGPIVDEKEGHYGSLANRLLCNSLVPKDTVFDSFCPSIKKDLKARTCEDCGKYFATKKSKLSHRKSQVCKESNEYLLDSEEEEEESDKEMEEEINNESSGLPIIDASTDPDAYVNVFENLQI